MPVKEVVLFVQHEAQAVSYCMALVWNLEGLA